MLGFERLFKVWEQLLVLPPMRSFFYFFAINTTIQKKHDQLILTVFDLEYNRFTKWHKLFHFKRYGVYLRGSTDRKGYTV